MLLSAILASVGVSIVGAQSGPAEHAVKAAFIYNFAKFIKWSPEAFSRDENALTICIWGPDTLNGALAPLADKTVHDRRIAVRHLAEESKVAGCQIVYVSRAAAARLDQALTKVSGKHILTVGDMPRFADRGGIINMYKTQERVRFEINLEAARTSGLSISSRLLDLARIVRRSN